MNRWKAMRLHMPCSRAPWQSSLTTPSSSAHAAWALEHRSTMGWPPIGSDDRERCVGLARRGLRFAAGDPSLMAKCGMALLQTGKDYDGGMAVVQAAAAANPNDLFVTAAASVATMHCGDMDEAIQAWDGQGCLVVRMAPQPAGRVHNASGKPLHGIRVEMKA
jgi:hypothetical protein